MLLSLLFGVTQISLTCCMLNELLMQLFYYQESKGSSKLCHISQELRDTQPQSNSLCRPHSYHKIFGEMFSERGIRTELGIFKQLVMAVWSTVLKRISGNIQDQWRRILLNNEIKSQCPGVTCVGTEWIQLVYTEHFKMELMWDWECCFLSCTLRSQKSQPVTLCLRSITLQQSKKILKSAWKKRKIREREQSNLSEMRELTTPRSILLHS